MKVNTADFDGDPSKIIIGKPLPGLKHVHDLPEGTRFIDQKPLTNLGELAFAGTQDLPEARTRWVGSNGTEVIVEPQDFIVESVHQPPLSQRQF